MKREIVSLALNALADRHISDTMSYSPGSVQSAPERIIPMKKKRIVTFVLAAVLMLSLGIAAYAAAGFPRWTVTIGMDNTGEYTSLNDLPEIERITGFDIVLPERFQNGYVFAKLRVDGEAVCDEDNNVLKEYYGVRATYSSASGKEMILSIAPVLDLPNSPEPPAPTARRMAGDREIRIYRDHYKLVPEDYEKTPEDLAAENSGHYYISFGADRIEERDFVSAEVVLNRVDYTFFFDNSSDCTDEMLTQMASELINAAG